MPSKAFAVTGLEQVLLGIQTGWSELIKQAISHCGTTHQCLNLSKMHMKLCRHMPFAFQYINASEHFVQSANVAVTTSAKSRHLEYSNLFSYYLMNSFMKSILSKLRKPELALECISHGLTY